MNARTNKKRLSSSKDPSLVQSVRAGTETFELSDAIDLLAKFITSFTGGGDNGPEAWWYVAMEDPTMKVDLPTISQKVLMFGGDDGMDFLARCGILKIRQGRYEFNRNGTNSFISGFMFQDIMEYTQKKVTGDTKSRYYIRLGKFRCLKDGKVWRFTPLDQVTSKALHPPSTRMPKLRDELLQGYVCILATEYVQDDKKKGKFDCRMTAAEGAGAIVDSLTAKEENEILKERVRALEDEVQLLRARVRTLNKEEKTRAKKAREEKSNKRKQNLDKYVSIGDLGDHVPTVHERDTADFLRGRQA